MAQHISTATDPLARRIRDVLRSKAARPRTIIIDDFENITQALTAGVQLETVVLVSVAQHAAAAVTAARETLTAAVGAAAVAPFEFVTVEPAVVKELFGAEKHVRVFALAAAPNPPKLAALSAGEQLSGDIVVLDGVKIVGNIGAITRTACALNAAGIVLLNSDLKTVYDRRLVRASRGLVFSLPVIIASHAQLHDFIKAKQLSVVTLDIAATAPLHEIKNVREPVALVFGSERDGVSAELTALATHRYVVPMDPRVESLNVSVTAALALYQHSQAVNP